MNWFSKTTVAAGFLAVTMASAQAVPVEGNDLGEVAALGISGAFSFSEPDGTLRQDTEMSFGTFSALGSQGYATVDASDAASQIASFALGDLGSTGIFLELAFADFPSVGGTDADFDNVDQSGDFTFTITDAAINSFDTSPVGPGTQTSFEIVALGEVSFDYDAAPTEEFDTPTFFSLVLNGSSVDGSGFGTFSGTITTPPAFDRVTSVSEPGMLALFAFGLAATMGARRRRKSLN